MGRQLRRWYASWNASKDRELPDVDRLHDLLVALLPEQTKVSVVHGDYGLHNCRVAADGHIAAVIDWEIATLGDPSADLAYCMNAWMETPDESAGHRARPDHVARLLQGKELLGRYSERTGADLSQIDYYSCFNLWKTVCILQGVYARYVHGRGRGGRRARIVAPQRMDRSLRLAVEAAERLGR